MKFLREYKVRFGEPLCDWAIEWIVDWLERYCFVKFPFFMIENLK